MGKFLAVFTAYVLICMGYQIFRNPPELHEDSQITAHIFLTAVFLLLYDLRLYPKNLRKLDRFSQIIVEFLIAMFAMEIILLDFWIPLEHGTKALCVHAADKLSHVTDFDKNYHCITENLKKPSTQTTVTYVLSIFFLLAVLHAIRAVDFRALEDGPSAFFGDIVYRGKRFLNKRLRACGFGKRRVKIKECEEIASCRQKISKHKEKKHNPICECDPIDLNELNNFSKCNELNMDCDDSVDGDDSLKFGDFDIPDDSDLLLSDE